MKCILHISFSTLNIVEAFLEKQLAIALNIKK